MSDLILALSQTGSDTLYKQDQFQRGQQAPECLSSFANIPLFAFQISPPLKINSAWNSSMDGNFFMTWHFFHFGVWNSFTMSLYIDLENQQLKWVLKMLSVCTNLFRALFAACQWVSDLCFEVEEETNFAAFYKLRTMLSQRI